LWKDVGSDKTYVWGPGGFQERYAYCV
jgi:hypothetical protein